jgi:hypothetical protein
MNEIPASRPPGIWPTLDQAGARCMTLEGSDFLFIERSDAQDTLSASAARNLESLRSLVSENSIVLFDEAHRVEALVSLDRLLDMSIKDYSRIGIIGFAPSVSHQLGQWRRQHRLRNGLWTVVFGGGPPGNNVLRESLERHLLVPWVTRRHLKVLGRLRVPSKSGPNIHISSGSAGKAVVLAPHELLWDCVLVTVDGPVDSAGISAPLRHPERAVARIRQVLERGYPDTFFFDAGHNRFVRVQAKAVSKADAPQSVSDTTAQTTVVDPAVTARVENVARVLDDAFQTLSSTPAKGQSEESVSVKGNPVSAAGIADPVANAIEIRERLKRSVNLIDAAKWAKWRGVQSNPSAALGKYKKSKRIFAVRSGNRDLYPAFQFAENAEPLQVVQKILKIVPKEAQGWSLLSWFEARNALLKSRKPSEVLASEPAAVLRAAARFYSRDD